MKSLNKITLMATVALALTACQKGEHFCVSGTITNASDSVLYLENMSLAGPVTIDSVKLNTEGKFNFTPKRLAEAPEFYRLRIARSIINMSVDSTETITIEASYPTMARIYKVEGSDNCERIHKLSSMQIDLQEKIDQLARTPNLSPEQRGENLTNLINEYKEVVKNQYIYTDPSATSSYFALFQTIWVGNMAGLIFNPQLDMEDARAYGAVATSWDSAFPQAERTVNLRNITLEGMKTQRILRNRQNQAIDASQVEQSGIIDLTLTDNKGTEKSLSSLKGNVVLLDFHVFAASYSTERIMLLRELYNKYHDRGLEIYQVSFDSDEHFWKTQTAALPWVSVRTGDETDRVVTLYNVTNVPMFYLLDRNCSVVKRDAQIEDLDKEVQKLL